MGGILPDGDALGAGGRQDRGEPALRDQRVPGVKVEDRVLSLGEGAVDPVGDGDGMAAPDDTAAGLVNHLLVGGVLGDYGGVVKEPWIVHLRRVGAIGDRPEDRVAVVGVGHHLA